MPMTIIASHNRLGLAPGMKLSNIDGHLAERPSLSDGTRRSGGCKAAAALVFLSAVVCGEQVHRFREGVTHNFIILPKTSDHRPKSMLGFSP